MSRPVEILIQEKRTGGAIKSATAELKELDKSAQAASKSVLGPAKGLDDLKGKLDGMSSRAGAARQGYKALGDQLAAGTTQSKEAADGLRNIDDAAQTLSGGFGGLARAAGVASVAMLGMKVGTAAKELGDYGQQIKRTEQYFTAYAGGAAQATEVMTAMRSAIGGAATSHEMMQAASKYMSMGLADNAQEMAQLAEMAVMLGGDTRTASESMEEFALLLANQSILRLDTFGISGARVRERIEELMEAEKGLSREQAFLNAVMEQGTEKVNLLKDANVDAATSAEELRVAWEELRTEVGKGLAGPVGTVENFLADWAGGMATSLKMIFNDDPVEGYRLALERTKEQLDFLAENNVDHLDPQFVRLEERARYLEAALGDAGDSGIQGMLAIQRGAEDAKGAVDDLIDSVSVMWDIRINEAIRRAGDVDPTMAGPERGAVMADSADTWLAGAAERAARAADDKIKEEERAARTAQSAWERAAKASASAWEREVKDRASVVQRAVQQAMDYSAALTPGGTTDPFAPGSDGPFENLFRLKDIATHGTDKSPWDEVLGVGQEQAAELVRKFEAGIIDDSVKQFIDKDALIRQIQEAKLAESLQQAFAEELAAASGVETKSVLGLLGVADDKGEIDTGPTAKALADSMQKSMDAEAGTFETTGARNYGAWETGFLGAMSASSLAQKTITVMVEQAIGGLIP